MKKSLKTIIGTALLTATISAQANEPIWDGNKVNLIAEKLSASTYAYYPSQAKKKESKGIPVATSGGFVIGEKGVLLVDTMLNKRLNQQVQDMIKKVTDKPILFAVNTSFHGDHSYGNMYLPKDTQIIQHVNTKKYTDEHFVKDTQFMIQNFGKGRGIEEIKPVTGDILIPKEGKITVDLGNKSVDIIDFGFAQTGGDLFVWDSQDKVMWTGNPIITVKPSLPWLLDGHLIETLNTLQAVYDFLPDDARIIPGHGSVMKKSDMQWHIDYLTAIKTEVQKAIDDGLSMEQAVEQITLDQFKGYQLYPWVHPQLNVPAAYKDLKK